METQYLKNVETGRVFEANEHLLEYAATQGHIVPCDENGNKLMDDAAPDDSLKAELEQLKQENYDLKTELALYRQRDREGTEVESPAETTEKDYEPVEANRMDSLVEAIGDLEKDNPDHFVKTGKRAGKPRVEVLEAFAGIIEVSVEEADAAWDRFQG